MMIDGHSHVTFPLSEHIRAMDRAGIEKTILFSTTFHPEGAQDFVQVRQSMQFLADLLAGKKGSMVEARRKSIAELADAIEQYPTRYIGFGNVPVGLNWEDTKQYIDENICSNHLAGLGEFTVGKGQTHLLENIFKASREFGNLPIWIHAFFPLELPDIQSIAGMAKSHPDIPVILGHLGGINWMDTVEMAGEITNLFLDTSASYSTFVLRAVLHEVPNKCIFGVDRPFGDIDLAKQTILSLVKSKAIIEEVMGANIARLLRI